MSLSRVIEVSFNGGSIAYVKADTAYFYNNGILFKPTDIDLPASYQVHWADSPQASSTLETIGTSEGAPIPDDLWNRSRVIYGWIYLHPTEDSGVTAYEVRIYKNVRAGLPDGTEPTPAEQSTIDQAIGALNAAVAKTAQDVESADESARSASDDADRAERARTGAETAQSKAEDAQESAERAKDDAETSERNASESERKAKGYAETASEKADAITGLTAQATTLPDGSSASASYNAETGVMSFGIPKGKDGTDGDDGYSPTANVSKTGKVATITITDKNGTTSAQVEDGTDGIDGISPSVSVTDITGGHRVVITDKDGTKSFDVEDGETGATPNLTIGTVETLEPAESATATITGTAEDPVLNLGIPRGQTGEVTEEEFTQLKEDLSDVNNTLKFNSLGNTVVDNVILSANDKWSSLSGYKFYIFQISPLSTISFQSNTTNAGYYCFLKSNSVVVGNSADLATNSHRTEVPANTTVTLTAPNDANYIYVAIGTDSTPRTPASVLLDNNYELLKTIQYNINNTLTQAKDYTDTLIKNSNTFIGDSSGGHYFKYALYNGHFYLIENNSQSGTVNVISRATVGGSNIQILATQLAYGTHKIVKCTADASYLYVYTTAASELFVNDLGSVDDAVKLSQSGIIIAADGSGDFSTLRDGIGFATQIPNCMVYVKDGTYNLTTEFATEISASSTTQYGIALKNGVHIVFSSGAEVTAIYEGNDEHVTTYFAPFYADESGGGFTLENLTITAKNTRYCVHDEFNGADVKATNKYINCRMIFDNTTAPTANYPQCIGGGFATNTYVEIDGCYFKSKRAETQKTPLVSYHNTNRSADALSYVSLKNCYFDDTYGIFRISYHGASTKVSIAYLSGNSFGGAPEVAAANGSSTEVNVAIVDWNNTVRT